MKNDKNQMEVRPLYIYPDNLKSKAAMWFWELRDLAIIGVLAASKL